MSTSPDRRDIFDMLAPLGGRSTLDTSETIDSMELAWLVQQVETRYRVSLPLSDDQLDRMSTVDGAVDVLRVALGADAHD